MGRDDFPRKASGDLQEGEHGHDKAEEPETGFTWQEGRDRPKAVGPVIREREAGLGVRRNRASQRLWQPWGGRRKPELCFWGLLALWPQLGEELRPGESE